MFCLRSQVIEKVRTTRSTWPDCSADSRWPASTTCRSMRSGSPKMRARDLAGEVDVESLELTR